MKVFLSFIILVYMICGKLYGQQDALKLKVINYLIEKGELDEVKNKEKYLDNIYITDIVNSNSNKETCDAIYNIGTFSSHSLNYLMVKNGQDYLMMDLNNLDEVLIYVIDFLKERKKSPQEILINVEAILLLYQKNLKAMPWTNN
jgi:hypothetical protein